jgi:hypothetical protein
MTPDSSEAYVTREKSKEVSTFEADTIQIGVSRPTLPLADLPQPEEVFNVRRIKNW